MYLVILSGGFDPVHIGHISMINDAAKYGDVVICLNSDEWLTRKKGKPFMTWKERATIIGNIKNVIDVIEIDDFDNSACDGIRTVYSKYKSIYDKIYFGNGGDRNEKTIPSREQVLSKELGIEMLWGLGGNNKPQSSSWVLNKWIEPKEHIKPWGHYKNLKETDKYKIKEITINPKHRLSLQYHNYRSELWMVVKGEIIANNSYEDYILKEGEYIFIPRLYSHRITNSTNEIAIVIEIQYGDKVVEEDIIRLEDDYKNQR